MTYLKNTMLLSSVIAAVFLLPVTHGANNLNSVNQESFISSIFTTSSFRAYYKEWKDVSNPWIESWPSRRRPRNSCCTIAANNINRGGSIDRTIKNTLMNSLLPRGCDEETVYTFERNFVVFLVMWVILNSLCFIWRDHCTKNGTGIGKKENGEKSGTGKKQDGDKSKSSSSVSPSVITSIVSERPTFLAGSLHAILMSVMSITCVSMMLLEKPKFIPIDDKVNVCLNYGYNQSLASIDPRYIWQVVALPLSLSYNFADMIFFCYPRRDYIITLHHIIMIIGHYPVGYDEAAMLLGGGDRNWIVLMSAIGYISEVSTVLMNYRWYLLRTLDKPWIGFTLVNICAAFSWFARTTFFTYALFFEIFPRTASYFEKKQLLAYLFLILSDMFFVVISAYWLKAMCRGNVKNLLELRPNASQKKKKGDENFFCWE